MRSIRNTVHLIGNIGLDPEVKVLSNGRKMARFRLATTDRYRNSEGKMIRETQWHTVIVWGNLATIVERYLNKGREIAIDGKIIYRNYEDKDGKTRYVTEIVANDIALLNNKKGK